jgi:transcriptional regulator
MGQTNPALEKIMHYEEFKLKDPRLVAHVLRTFPFAAILVNTPDGPAVAQAPMTFRDSSGPAGAVEFHLAKANPIAGHMLQDVPITILARGPGAHVSPSWFSASYPTPGADRSRTAPTYNYLSLVINGRLSYMDDQALQVQIQDLVRENEPADGWKTSELAPDLWGMWRKVIQGYRLEIDRFDLTAKFSEGDIPADRPGVIQGLRTRAAWGDLGVARVLDLYDGSPDSLQRALEALRSGGME